MPILSNFPFPQTPLLPSPLPPLPSADKQKMRALVRPQLRTGSFLRRLSSVLRQRYPPFCLVAIAHVSTWSGPEREWKAFRSRGWGVCTMRVLDGCNTRLLPPVGSGAMRVGAPGLDMCASGTRRRRGRVRVVPRCSDRLSRAASLARGRSADRSALVLELFVSPRLLVLCVSLLSLFGVRYVQRVRCRSFVPAKRGCACCWARKGLQRRERVCVLAQQTLGSSTMMRYSTGVPWREGEKGRWVA